MEIARQWGKTRLLVTIACEAAAANPGARIVYGAPTLKHLQEFILPTFDAVIADAPPECRPTWNQSKGHWEFPNGAYVHLFGADDKRKAARGRGPKAVLVIFDEAGFTPILAHVLDDIFKAQTLHSDGMTLLGSTPAEEPEHDFTRIAEIAEGNGNYARRTIYDNPLLTPQQIERFIADGARDKGLSVEDYVKTDTFRREYLAERVVNKLLVVVPEWEAARGTAIEAIQRPEFFDGMGILDMGGNDPHAAVWGYYHFTGGFWVAAEDELLMRDGENTAQLAEAIKGKETSLYGEKGFDGTLRAFTDDADQKLLDAIPEHLAEVLARESKEHQPYIRWSDNDALVVRDLWTLHRLAFVPTAKDDKELQVNNLRVLISKGKLKIHPRCVHTDRHLRSTTWKDHKRRDYARKGGEHGDLVDCLVYGARNLDTQRNPTPKNWGVGHGMRPARNTKPTTTSELTRAFYGGTSLGRKLAGLK